MAKKTYNEKLNNPVGLPKIKDLTVKPEAVKRLGGVKMLIAAPSQYNDIMAAIPGGKLTTVDRIRAHLAAQAAADVTCPLTAGIFTNICAHASEERGYDKIPWWRTLKINGELNEKYLNRLKDGGRVSLDLQEVFFTKCLGSLTDKFGLNWFVVYYPEAVNR